MYHRILISGCLKTASKKPAPNKKTVIFRFTFHWFAKNDLSFRRLFEVNLMHSISGRISVTRCGHFGVYRKLRQFIPPKISKNYSFDVGVLGFENFTSLHGNKFGNFLQKTDYIDFKTPGHTESELSPPL